MLKGTFAIYKGFEKYFLKEDKTKDMVTYIKIKHQFRSMMCFTVVSFIVSIFMSLLYQSASAMSPLLAPAVLIGFRTKSYRTITVLFSR